MEKHQIVRHRRLYKTPWMKFSSKAAIITGVVSLAVACGYNYWRSDLGTYIMRSGYYDDEELNKQAMRMSLMTMFTLKPREPLLGRIKEEDSVSDMSTRPFSIPEAELDV